MYLPTSLIIILINKLINLINLINRKFTLQHLLSRAEAMNISNAIVLGEENLAEYLPSEDKIRSVAS